VSREEIQDAAIARVADTQLAAGPDLLIAGAVARATGDRRVEAILLLAGCITVLTNPGIRIDRASAMVDEAAATLVAISDELFDQASLRS
jgi:hypothetical protein